VAEHVLHGVELAQVADVPLHAQLHREVAALRALGAVPHHQQYRGHFAPHRGEDPHDVLDPLARTEVRDVHHDALVLPSEPLARTGILPVPRPVALGVDEVRDHLDRALRMEDLDRLPLQIVRDRGDAIALVDAESRQRPERLIRADQRDVGAVERRRHPELRRRRDLPREVGADRVRDGVVRVEDVESVLVRDLRHLRRERERVRRILEERVRDDLHLVEEHVLLVALQTERNRVGDEVDLVSAARELDPELGRDHARSAVGGIAADADLHDAPPRDTSSCAPGSRVASMSRSVSHAPWREANPA
jgi:hypothetical protein